MSTSAPSPGSSLHDILSSQQNALDDLIGVYEANGRPVPWFGAGASFAYGFPTWTGFLRGTPTDARTLAKVEKFMRAGKYEKAADLAYSAMGAAAFESRFRDTFCVDGSIPTGPTLLTQGIRLIDNLAVTTNYENVLPSRMEVAFGKAPRLFDVLDPDLVHAPTRPELSLWRLHGPANNFEQRVLRTREYDEKYGRRWFWQSGNSFTPLERYLNGLFPRRFIFLGCSLTNDRTMQAMEKWADAAQATTLSFAILEAPPTEDQVARNKFLSDRNIRPIYYPRGDHGVLPGLIGHIADRVEPMLQRAFGQMGRGFSIQSRLAKGEAKPVSTAMSPHLDLTHLFEEQSLHPSRSWVDVATCVDDFLTANPCDGDQRIDCAAHLSVAYHLGTRFPDSDKRRAQLVQRFGAKSETWSSLDGRSGPAWRIETAIVGTGDEWGIVVDSKVRGVEQAIAFLKTLPVIGNIIIVRPPDGDDGFVKGGQHANSIADSIVQAAKDNIPPTAYHRIKHVVVVGPWALAFSLGQKSMTLGRVQLYEYLVKDGQYVASLDSVRS